MYGNFMQVELVIHDPSMQVELLIYDPHITICKQLI